jgi:hypothetical protein
MDFHKNGIRTVEVSAATLPYPLSFFLAEANEKNGSCEKIRDGVDALLFVSMTHPNA